MCKWPGQCASRRVWDFLSLSGAKLLEYARFNSDCRSISNKNTGKNFLRERVQHYLQLGAAWILIMIGVILLLSPIPIGIFFISIGLTLLIYTSDVVRVKVHGYREVYPIFNRKLIWVENKLENRVGFVSRTLQKTRPMS